MVDARYVGLHHDRKADLGGDGESFVAGLRSSSLCNRDAVVGYKTKSLGTAQGTSPRTPGFRARRLQTSRPTLCALLVELVRSWKRPRFVIAPLEEMPHR